MLGVQKIREMQSELQELAHQEFGFWFDWDDIMKLAGGTSPKDLLLSKGYKRPREAIKDVLYKSLSSEFETVTLGDGYKDSIHIQIISSKFADKGDNERVQMIYAVLDDPNTGLLKAEESLICLILPFAPDEIEGG